MTPRERTLDACLWGALGLPLKALAFALNASARSDRRLARALALKDCAYRLENRDGSRAWYLVFHNGRVGALRRAPFAPVSTLTFVRNRALATLRPEELLTAMIDNDVVQSGGTYDLYRLGFVFDLLRRRLTPSPSHAVG